MKNQENKYNNLRQVILLLAIAVILPTVCLLWFMTQAVKNERLAIRQKLIDIYSQKAEEFITQTDKRYDNFAKNLQQLVNTTEPFRFGYRNTKKR